MTVSPLSVDSETWAQCVEFYRRETLLLQRRNFAEWLTMFEPGLDYVVPTVESVGAGSGVEHRRRPLAYYEESFETLAVRVRKLESKSSWSEIPPSRNRYFIQVIEVEGASVERLRATTNMLLFQYRDSIEQWFTAERCDELVRRASGDLGVVRREVMLDRPVLGSQGLSVFF